ncbi:MAG TPA: TolC family protein [Prolixibacteraceae bacterium]|nr:TolC family protein [Prolixibacteraceae bacterium]HPT31990.1 TolC family protein [Prolixibacteraceae bacterium]
MKKLFFTTFCMIAIFGLHAQNGIQAVLQQIEQNSPALKSLNSYLEAEKAGNKTGLYPDNPEAGIGYLWGNPAMIGKRHDINVTQSFDFPTAYLYRSQMAGIKNRQSEWLFQKKRKELLLEAKLACIDLVWCNRQLAETSRRLGQAGRIASAYQTRFNAGETALPDVNRAKLDEMNVRQELKHLETGRKSLLTLLAGMNGGIPLELKDTLFPAAVIPADFEAWYSQAEGRHPQLQWLQQESELSRKEIGLATSLALPGFNAGYMSEKITGEQFSGITAGITIPLWAGKNQVKQARLKNLAAVEAGAAGKISIKHELRAKYDQAVELRSILEDYRNNLLTLDNSAMALKALELGDISLIEYLMELSIWYNSRAKALDLERELHKVMAELEQYN